MKVLNLIAIGALAIQLTGCADKPPMNTSEEVAAEQARQAKEAEEPSVFSQIIHRLGAGLGAMGGSISQPAQGQPVKVHCTTQRIDGLSLTDCKETP